MESRDTSTAPSGTSPALSTAPPSSSSSSFLASSLFFFSVSLVSASACCFSLQSLAGCQGWVAFSWTAFFSMTGRRTPKKKVFHHLFTTAYSPLCTYTTHSSAQPHAYTRIVSYEFFSPLPFLSFFRSFSLSPFFKKGGLHSAR